MAKLITFTPAKLATATANLVTWSTSVDSAFAAGGKALLAWGQQAIAGIQANKIDLDAIKAAIITATQQHNPKACDKPVADWRIGDCGSTIKGRFYALARIAADPASCDKLLAGEAFNVVAKAAPQVQQQAAKKSAGGTKGKTKARAVTLETALEAVNSWLDQAIAGDAEMARGLAQNADLALVIAKAGKLAAVIKADAEKTRKAAAATKAAAAATKAGQSIARKAKATATKASAAATKASAAADKARIAAAKAGRKSGKGTVTVKLLKAA